MGDASFCIQRWKMKGGGVSREDNHHSEGLEQWLWRALWDIYVAFDINTIESWERLNIVDPMRDDASRSIKKSESIGSFDELCDLDDGLTPPLRRSSVHQSSTTMLMMHRSLRDFASIGSSFSMSDIDHNDGDGDDDEDSSSCNDDDNDILPIRRHENALMPMVEEDEE